ncbi:MAG: 7TM diverse intracellular signaling domain-containing protein, partial [Oceanobacter sp.]
MEWILDPEEQDFSVNDIRFDGQEPPAESGWKSIKSSPPYINKINETLWFRAPVHWNEQPYDLRLLTVDWYYLDFIEVYACSDSCRRLLESKETGAVRFGNTIPLIYELSPHDGQSFELYIRVSSLAKLALPMSVWQESELQSFEHRHVLLMGVYVGILLVMALYNLVLSYMLRDRNYLIYVLYVFSAILFALSMNGIGRAYLWGENDWLNGRMIPLVSSLMFGLVLGFFFSLLKVSRWKSWQTYLSRG